MGLNIRKFFKLGFPVPQHAQRKTAIISMTYGGPIFLSQQLFSKFLEELNKVFGGLCGCRVRYLRFYEVLT